MYPVKQNIELLQEYVTKQLVNVENTINGCLQEIRTYIRDLVDTLSNKTTEMNEILMQRAREESMNNDLQTMTAMMIPNRAVSFTRISLVVLCTC